MSAQVPVSQPPVRIKLYGLFSLTRRQYIIQQAISVIVLAALVAIHHRAAPLVASLRQLPDAPAGAWRLFGPLFDATPWIVVSLAVLLGLETVLVLRQFSRKERERRVAEILKT